MRETKQKVQFYCFHVLPHCCFAEPPATRNNDEFTTHDLQCSTHVFLFIVYVLYFLPSLISGNEVLFSLETASDYVKDEKACFYGFKCVAVGFEFNPGPDEVQICWKYISFGTSFSMGGVRDCHLYLIMHSRTMLCSRLNDMMCLLQYFNDNHLWPFQGLIMLEKELAYLGSVCAAALMKKDLALPIGTEIVNRKICWCTFLNEMFFFSIYNTRCGWMWDIKQCY